MTVLLTVKNSSGTVTAEERVLDFSFRKDVYIPYTEFSARAEAESGSFDNAAEVLLSIDGNTVHHGLIDSLRLEKKGGKSLVRISSRGFTSLLCQNQIEPGLKMNISFNSLMDDYCTLPYVEHEYNSDNSSYIYVRPNTSMWDAAANLSYKLLGTYPYIKGTNRVMISPAAAPGTFDLSSREIIAMGSGLMYSRLASDYHMADMGGNYGTFDLHDADVSARRIVRHKYFDLDMRFLYDPQQALAYRNKFDSRGLAERYCSYSGYCGEDLCDLVSFGNVTAQPVGSLSIKGSSRGIFTETGVYTDRFPHSQT